MDLPPNERLVGQTVQRPTLPTPPYTGYGDELTNANDNSWRKLIPTKPKKDYNKIIGLDGQVLRFTAKLESSNPDDERRDFVFSYFLHDDTLRVFEPPIHNSGIVGGKFLEKGKYKHESGTRYLQPSDIISAAISALHRHLQPDDIWARCGANEVNTRPTTLT